MMVLCNSLDTLDMKDTYFNLDSTHGKLSGFMVDLVSMVSKTMGF